MSFSRTLSLFSLVLVGSLAACGGDENSASDSSEFAQKYCELMAGCCGENGYPSDGEQCRTLFAFSSGEYDADAGEKCLAAARTAAGANPNWCTDTQSGEAEAACDKVFVEAGGSAQPGDECKDDGDCALGASGDYVTCAFAGDSFEDRKCQRLSPVAEGAACAGDGRVVEGELSIDNTTSSQFVATGGFCPRSADLTCDSTAKTCTKLIAVGEPCTNTECVDGAYCNYVERKCTPLIAAGESCAGTGDRCVERHNCDPTTRVCTALKATGESCAASAECESFSCEEGKCAGGFGAALGLALLCGEKE